MLFGPHLRVVRDNITVSPPHKLVREGGPCTRVMGLLQERSPELEVLQVGAKHRSPAVGALISDAVCGFSRLVIVNFDPFALSWRALVHLGSLNSLQTLYTYLPPLTLEAEAHSPSCMFGGTAYFPSLREIRLTHKEGLAPCAVVLALIRSPHLHTVTIRSGTRRTPVGDPASLFAALGTCPAAPVIQHLTIDIPGVRNNAEIPTSAFRPLLALRNLAAFSLNTPAPLGADDAFLHAAAAAWPLIAYLHLGITPPDADHSKSTPPVRVTLEGVVDFLRRSPQVHTLGLSFATCAKSLPGALRKACPAGRGATQAQLRTLNVGCSRIEREDVPRVAAVLSDVGPGLQGVWSGWQCEYECESDDEDEDEAADAPVLRIPLENGVWLAETAMRARWGRVKRYISMFVGVRQQEREWASGRGMKLVMPDDIGA
ncbi:hypothetical protein C8Q78DRAFT_1051959 [Trametes maxima]|nr:hypothetical protein C8Q78DRAFT_1051959 [Trametes maxima]